MDITDFMVWFISQVTSMFSSFFSILDSITFAGTSLLRFSVTLLIISALVGVVFTLSKGVSVIASRSERVKRNKEAEE